MPIMHKRLNFTLGISPADCVMFIIAQVNPALSVGLKSITGAACQVSGRNIGNAHHAPSEKRSTKSADGRMATEAAWLERKESTGRKETEKNILVEKKREKHP
jgi:hypothetical protein